ncbi:SDR family NAD(P)-dependent oxidoreductase [Marmoricola sp. RAF53]|uniref:SDR family NAD(P)-dependent oxidoreductase n=1 Tax=Marmoricola sp. RAF53 TaxID=3233059 RepID=UPI003F9CA674
MNETFSIYPDLAGKAVLCVGAASGIGLSMAHGFAANGADVALMDVNTEALEHAAAELKATHRGSRVVSVAASVTVENDVLQTVDATLEAFGRIDVLVNNAGVSGKKSSLDLTADDWRRIVDIDLTGAFLVAQSVGRHMVARGSGVILTTASMWGVATSAGRVAYSAAKTGVVAMTKGLAVEWAPAGVRVNAIAPGYIHTPMIDDLVAQGAIDLDALSRATPARRLGRPGEVTNAALYLASDAAEWITGHALVIDGGWTANGDLMPVPSPYDSGLTEQLHH